MAELRLGLARDLKIFSTNLMLHLRIRGGGESGYGKTSQPA